MGVKKREKIIIHIILEHYLILFYMISIKMKLIVYILIQIIKIMKYN